MYDFEKAGASLASVDPRPWFWPPRSLKIYGALIAACDAAEIDSRGGPLVLFGDLPGCGLLLLAECCAESPWKRFEACLSYMVLS